MVCQVSPLVISDTVEKKKEPPVALPGSQTFPYDVLKTAPPDGVDLANKELYLTAPIFLSVFEMDAKSFESLPKWKKDLIKKKVGLF